MPEQQDVALLAAFWVFLLLLGCTVVCWRAFSTKGQFRKAQQVASKREPAVIAELGVPSLSECVQIIHYPINVKVAFVGFEKVESRAFSMKSFSNLSVWRQKQIVHMFQGVTIIRSLAQHGILRETLLSNLESCKPCWSFAAIGNHALQIHDWSTSKSAHRFASFGVLFYLNGNPGPFGSAGGTNLKEYSHASEDSKNSNNCRGKRIKPLQPIVRVSIGLVALVLIIGFAWLAAWTLLWYEDWRGWLCFAGFALLGMGAVIVLL
jgi:hypothetical protein